MGLFKKSEVKKKLEIMRKAGWDAVSNPNLVIEDAKEFGLLDEDSSFFYEIGVDVFGDELMKVWFGGEESGYGSNPFEPNEFLGQPPSFITSADPMKRVYGKTIMADMPMVNLIPGRPQFYAYDKAIRVKYGKNGKNISEKELLNLMANFDEGGDDKGGIVRWLSDSAKSNTSNRDLRYYGFRPTYADYFGYAQLLLSTVAVKMGISNGLYNFRNEYSKDFYTSGLRFYADKSTSVTESASNNFGASMLEGATKAVSSTMRELQFLLGIDVHKKDAQNVSSMNDTVRKQIDDISSNAIFDKLTDSRKTVSTIMGGSNMLYPHVWKDSTFDRSYSLSFRFVSPYGDKESIFKYIYTPFLLLLALSLPRQDTLAGYYSPFIVRVDSPGYFTCDMGVVTSLTFKKGGNDGLFTKDGYPLEMEVSLNIKDLYPTLMATSSYAVLRHNIGLSGFLDNMATLDIERLADLDHLKETIAMKGGNITGFFNKKIQGIESGLSENVGKIFRVVK